jgi:hypothetical protein
MFIFKKFNVKNCTNVASHSKPHSWQNFQYIMEICGMIWNESNEDIIFKKTL